MPADEGTRPVRAEPAAVTEATAATGPQSKGPRWLLPAGALLLAAVLAAYLANLVTHLSYMAAMRDLVVYRNGGLIVRHVSPAYDPHRASPLYDWTGQNGVQFTYPPFAAVIFAVASVLSWTAMRWAMTPGQPGRPRPVAVAGVRRARLPRPARGPARARRSGSPRSRWPPNPSSRPSPSARSTCCSCCSSWRTCSPAARSRRTGRTRWWHGLGIGIAAGVKLTPLIFIPYLLLIRRYRQAATATARVRGHGGARLRDPAARFRHVLGARAVPEGQPDRVPRRPGQPVAARRR